MNAETQKLLDEYVEQGSESVFRKLVHRYLDLVYSAAIRLVDGDSQLAKDVAKACIAIPVSSRVRSRAANAAANPVKNKLWK